MKSIRLIVTALLALHMPAGAIAQDADIVVQADVSRMEIERILRADNIDTARLSSHEVVVVMASVERGRAPGDFWAAYRTHVSAWIRFAAIEAPRRRKGVSGFEGMAEWAKAERAIDSTFDEVERIARRYGAQLPPPAWKIRVSS
jgi:hypothetical protein